MILVTQCAWCRKVKDGSDYVAASPVKWVKVSHGVCPACLADAREKLGLDRAPENKPVADERRAA